MIPTDRNLSVETVLKYGAEVNFPNGSMVYLATELGKKFYVAQRAQAKNGQSHGRFPVTKQGLYDAFKFLQ